MKLHTIEHLTLNENAMGRVEIKTDEGFVYYDKDNYKDLTDEEGNNREPSSEEISYFRYGVFAPETDFKNRIVVVDETTINANQIF
jgi:hypothetical protein